MEGAMATEEVLRLATARSRRKVLIDDKEYEMLAPGELDLAHRALVVRVAKDLVKVSEGELSEEDCARTSESLERVVRKVLPGLGEKSRDLTHDQMCEVLFAFNGARKAATGQPTTAAQ